MKLDPQKTTGALAAAAIVSLADWAAQYFWHVTIPETVNGDIMLLLTIVLTHVPIFSTPPTAG